MKTLIAIIAAVIMALCSGAIAQSGNSYDWSGKSYDWSGKSGSLGNSYYGSLRDQQIEEQQRRARENCEFARSQYILRSIAAGGDLLQIYANADAIFPCD